MTVSDGHGTGLVAFLDWAGKRGEMSPATAKACIAAVRRVLAVEPGAEGHPLAEMDIDNLVDRFETLSRLEFTPASMATYKSRFRSSVAMYLAWLEKDPNWKHAGKSPSQQKASKAAKASAASRAARKVEATVQPQALSTRTHPVADPPPHVGATRLVSYDLPLRQDLMVRLTLPVDLSKADAARLNAFVNSLAFDAAEGNGEREPGSE